MSRVLSYVHKVERRILVLTIATEANVMMLRQKIQKKKVRLPNVIREWY